MKTRKRLYLLLIVIIILITAKSIYVNYANAKVEISKNYQQAIDSKFKREADSLRNVLAKWKKSYQTCYAWKNNTNLK